MAFRKTWRRWFRKTRRRFRGGKNLPLQRAYLKQRRLWDFAIAVCGVLTVVAAILKPSLALLPALTTGFAIYQYRKCNRIAEMIGEAEELRRWVEKLQKEEEREERLRHGGSGGKA